MASDPMHALPSEVLDLVAERLGDADLGALARCTKAFAAGFASEVEARRLAAIDRARCIMKFYAGVNEDEGEDDDEPYRGAQAMARELDPQCGDAWASGRFGGVETMDGSVFLVCRYGCAEKFMAKVERASSNAVLPHSHVVSKGCAVFWRGLPTLGERVLFVHAQADDLVHVHRVARTDISRATVRALASLEQLSGAQPKVPARKRTSVDGDYRPLRRRCPAAAA